MGSPSSGLRSALGGRAITVALLLAAALTLAAWHPAPLRAQVEARPTLEGVVVRPDGPVPGGEVILHRVTAEEAGEIDTVSVGDDGGFRFELPTVPDPEGRNEVYFASASHHGVLYFGPAITTAVQLDSLYRIEVHDTASVPVEGASLPVAVRYMIVEDPATARVPPSATAPAEPRDREGDEGWLVTDLLQPLNDGDETLVPREGGVVWSYPLPPGATDVEVGGAGITPDAAQLVGGRVAVSQPLPPGPRQSLVRYRLEGPTMEIPLPGRTRSMELLIREPAPPFEVAGLEARGPVTMEEGGATYRRFVGTDLVDATVTLVEGEEEGGVPGGWLAVTLAAILTAVGLWAALRRSEPPPPTPVQTPGPAGPVDHPAAATLADRRRELILEIARIDDELESGPAAKREKELRARRADLKDRLKTLEASESSPSPE